MSSGLAGASVRPARSAPCIDDREVGPVGGDERRGRRRAAHRGPAGRRRRRRAPLGELAVGERAAGRRIDARATRSAPRRAPAERLLVQQPRREVEVVVAVAPEGGVGHRRRPRYYAGNLRIFTQGPCALSRSTMLSDEDQRPFTIMMAFRQTARLMIEELIERLKADGHEGVHPSHHALYENIDAEGTRLTELAARAAMTHQAMGELVGLARARRLGRAPARPHRRPRAAGLPDRRAAGTSSSAGCTTSPRSRPSGRSAGGPPATTASCGRSWCAPSRTRPAPAPRGA